MRRVLRRILSWWRELRYEPSPTDVDAQPEHCDAIVAANRRRHRLRMIERARQRREWR